VKIALIGATAAIVEQSRLSVRDLTATAGRDCAAYRHEARHFRSGCASRQRLRRRIHLWREPGAYWRTRR
jgi:hypothetical protein